MSKSTLMVWLALCSGAACLEAQSTTAEITGVIMDASGAAVPNASVTVANVNTGFSRKTSSSDQGIYRVPLLPPDVYSVTVVHAGFRPITRSDVELKVDQTARLDFYWNWVRSPIR
jgi:hypothetical protein